MLFATVLRNSGHHALQCTFARACVGGLVIVLRTSHDRFFVHSIQRLSRPEQWINFTIGASDCRLIPGHQFSSAAAATTISGGMKERVSVLFCVSRWRKMQFYYVSTTSFIWAFFCGEVLINKISHTTCFPSFLKKLQEVPSSMYLRIFDPISINYSFRLKSPQTIPVSFLLSFPSTSTLCCFLCVSQWLALHGSFTVLNRVFQELNNIARPRGMGSRGTIRCLCCCC